MKKTFILITLCLFAFTLFSFPHNTLAGCCVNGNICKNAATENDCKTGVYNPVSCTDLSECVTASPKAPTTPAASSSNTSAQTGNLNIDMPTGFGLPDPYGGIKEIAENFLSWLLGIIGLIALIAFVISGIQYFMAAGNETTAQTAKRNMTYTIIGITLAYWLLLFVSSLTRTPFWRFFVFDSFLTDAVDSTKSFDIIQPMIFPG